MKELYISLFKENISFSLLDLSVKATAKPYKALAKDPMYLVMLIREDGSYTKSKEEVVNAFSGYKT